MNATTGPGNQPRGALASRISELIGADTAPADDDLLIDLAESVREARATKVSSSDDTDAIYSLAALGRSMGEVTGAVLARLLRAGEIIARQRELIADASHHVSPCPAPDIAGGLDLCLHGSAWPCPSTILAWRLRGLDPAAEQARIMRAIRNDMAIAAEMAAADPSDYDIPECPS